MAVPGISHYCLVASYRRRYFQEAPEPEPALKMQEQSIEKCYAYIIKQFARKMLGKYNVYEFLLCEEEMKVKKKILIALLQQRWQFPCLPDAAEISGKETSRRAEAGVKARRNLYCPGQCGYDELSDPCRRCHGGDDRLMTYGPCYDPLFIVNK